MFRIQQYRGNSNYSLLTLGIDRVIEHAIYRVYDVLTWNDIGFKDLNFYYLYVHIYVFLYSLQ